MKRSTLAGRVEKVLALQSQTSGVSMRYLLSDGFAELAADRTGKQDPTFNEMQPGSG